MVDFEALERIIELQKLAGTAALTVCGTTGESVTMTPEEQEAVIAFCAERSGSMKIIAGAGTNDTARALAQARAAEDAGADAVLIVTPYYNKPTQRGLIDHYTAIADRISIPVILYNVPSRTGVAISPETASTLANHPNINGIKEASGGMELTSYIMSTIPDELQVWSGNDDLTVPMMALGAKGVISVAANVIPKEMAELTRCCLEGDFASARAVHAKYFDLMQALFMETNPIPVKTAMAEMGLCAGEFRLPLTEMGAENKLRLISVLEEYGLI